MRPRGAANHNPAAVVNGVAGADPVEIAARPSETVRLTSEGSTDPDGDRLRWRWFQYPEAGTSSTLVTIEGAATERAAFTVPASAKPGPIHVILEVQDRGDPSLFAYRCIIIKLQA